MTAEEVIAFLSKVPPQTPVVRYYFFQGISSPDYMDVDCKVIRAAKHPDGYLDNPTEDAAMDVVEIC